MKVKDLITELLDCRMDDDVLLCLPLKKERVESHTQNVKTITTGVAFKIEKIDKYSGIAYICFDDWREAQNENGDY